MTMSSRWLRMGLVLATGLWAGCAARTRDGARDPCGDFELDVAKVWNAQVKVELSAGGHGAGVDGAVARRNEVVTRLDVVARDWVMLRRSACRDRFVRQIVSDDEYKAKVSCFDAYLQKMRAGVTALQGDSEDADVMSALLEGPNQCR